MLYAAQIVNPPRGKFVICDIGLYKQNVAYLFIPFKSGVSAQLQIKIRLNISNNSSQEVKMYKKKK